MKTQLPADDKFGDEYEKSPVFMPRNSPRRVDISFKDEVKLEDEPTLEAHLHKNISIDRLTGTSNQPRENSAGKETETEFLRIEKEESSSDEWRNLPGNILENVSQI